MMRSLRARLIAAAIIFVTIALVLTWLSLTKLFSAYVAEQYEHELQAVADTIVANLAVKDAGLYLRREPTDPRFEIAAGGRYWQVNRPAQISMRSRSLWDTEIVPTTTAATGSVLMLADGPSGDPLLVLVQEVSLESNKKDYKATVYAAADYTEYATALTEFRTKLLSMLLLTGVFLMFSAVLQIYVGLRPLFDIRKSVNALRQGQLSQIDTKGPQEVQPLITEINSLMADNKAAVERARARASDLAHGLKTPLTILGQISESLGKKGDRVSAQMMGQQISTIRSRVDRQLALARAGNPGNAAIDVAATLQRLIKVTKPLSDARGISIETQLPTGLFIHADATDFLEATGNVLDNAIRHAGNKIFIKISNLYDQIRVSINDDGPGIQESERVTALQRGKRLDETGDGSGLGLAISSEILSAYGGSISLGQSDKGGLSVHMHWPTRLGMRP